MKKYLFSTLICSLLALVGCQQNDELMDLPTNNGEKVTLTANIQGSGNTRVDMTDQGEEGIKVDWKDSDETFTIYGAAYDEDENPILTEATFTQIEGTNQFSGTLPASVAGRYFASYKMSLALDGGDLNPVFDLSNQDGTLNEDNVLMLANFSPEDESDPIQFEFEHLTFILKPTFTIGEDEVDYTKITEIVVNGIKANANDLDVETVTITPIEQENIYIFVPVTQGTNYMPEYMDFTFDVTYNGNEYNGELIFKEGLELEELSAGKVYTATIALEEETAEAIPYVTFSAENSQEISMNTNITGLEYSLDGGEWTTLSTTKVTFGGEAGDLKLRGISEGGTYGATISFTDADVPVTCSGDIRTLIDWEDYEGITSSGAKFNNLFRNCTALTSAEDLVLPITTLTSTQSYFCMFQNCTKLVSPPSVLPATTLTESCYQSMFNGCTSLTTAPVLPATKLANFCYNLMFTGCTSLEEAPALPATELGNGCYSSMFNGCSKLVDAPEILPATTLASSCYLKMFLGCTSLTTAPQLPAETLVSQCYYEMFKGCTSLNSITMLATDITAGYCLSNWVSSVAAGGTFTKAAGLAQGNSTGQIKTGANGIPSGWTVEDYSN